MHFKFKVHHWLLLEQSFMDMESSSTSLMKEWQRVPTGHSRWFPVWNQIKSEIWNLVSVLFYPSLRPHKPNCSSEAMRSIDRAWQISRARNAPFPWEFLGNKQIVISLRGGTHKDWIRIIRLWLQGDNCPKEVRNSWTGKWACMLSQANYFVGVSHHHMVVGRTHEDIGAFV